ncbi:D-aminoacyl-tRNA deacylase [Syntrophorhabdus aromaticivorans]|uniref:D-aminoacyl-tRNA deacylase n=1 Tax=Syntrophorhabdus aromaticivorans TaxID=328301 RepID=A0A351U4M0_9BACT|nr:D-aminoacyl-tRNA deacylase [Syntrophorhabdus aromaticivorans]NLW33947.1 D-tyrosyl-tRNA(Tyr) deacylase [Syntrophorhabdus aromaticivorans]HBA54901.1 D-tyrosyl-tRNA(Tyr) deacylase [Syntrophorhabdus aromaticivorans]
MRAVVQRVKEASVTVEGNVVGRIGRGLLVLLGVGRDDGPKDIDWMIDKIINLRIFERDDGKFDESLLDVKGALLVVSQFTLYGDCRKGRRPSFSDAMNIEGARKVFEAFVEKAQQRVAEVATGVFQASMDVSLVNDGPVTLMVDSKSA